MDLQNRKVLITGGGTGAGADLARGFSEAGAEVIVTGRRLDRLEAVANRHANVRCVSADVASEAGVVAMFEAAGPVDVVIANAGIADSAPLARTSLDQWSAILAVNLTGVFLTLREGLRQMPGWGRLIAVSSVLGVRGAPYASAYAASKHGVLGLVRSAALEVARTPVTVNAICPGYIESEMTDRTIANIMEKTGRSHEQAVAELAATNPQRRLIRPAEITAAALYLCGPDSEGVNGQAIVLNGGEG